ncbi:MAG: hypothetical protein QF780_08635 [Candidatus Marinimicrobia bacterium]|jgi:hypothetical protein|nr:hypothetical protein [Candidatus Neomarinimicrobiota bacterium]|tara:strand:- start:5040 stop:5837 length:798 start_codon:yes stop_codon:yes gene_type:complete
MKNILTTRQLRQKHDPDSILKNIESFFEKNLDKLLATLSHADSPLIRYSANLQISFLDPDQKQDDLINKAASLLKDALYFMMLPKKERTSVTQRMRAYYSDVVKNQLVRVELILDDPEIGSPRHSTDPNSNHKAMRQVHSILSIIKKTLAHENDHRKNLTRAGYLTGLQVSMGKFFAFLKKIGMSQRDQISLIQHIFDEFDVDWEEGDRENIKVSIQQPSLEFHKITQEEIQKISGTLFSKSLDDATLSNLVEHAVLLSRRIRRF